MGDTLRDGGIDRVFRDIATHTKIVIVAGLVLLSGLFSGLTLGLLGLDVNGLEIIMRSNGMKGEITFKKSNVEAVAILKLNITQLTAKQSSNWEKLA